jgi:hypothetical protein
MNPTVSTVTDMAANFLAVLLLALMVLISTRARAPVPVADRVGTIASDNDLVSTTRAPLSAAQIVDLLYDRRETSELMTIDLHGGNAVIHVAGTITRLRLAGSQPDPSPVLPAAGDRETAVYVFDHRGYEVLVRLLTGRHSTWRELSVPDALRRLNSPGQQPGWSPAFLALLDLPPPKEQFRVALARLLGAAQPPRGAFPADPTGGGSASDPAIAEPRSTRAVRIRANWRRLAEVGALVLGLGFVAAVESVGLRRRRCLADPSRVPGRA